jgi:hypothetical protein
MLNPTKLGLLSYGMVENGAEWNADAGASRVQHSKRGYHKPLDTLEGIRFISKVILSKSLNLPIVTYI